MRITFSEKNPEKILKTIQDTMGSRSLSKMVSFAMDDGELVVTISKLGKSRLIFALGDEEEGTQFHLSEKKIALAHKAFEGEVTDKILRVIEKSGGTIEHV